MTEDKQARMGNVEVGTRHGQMRDEKKVVVISALGGMICWVNRHGQTCVIFVVLRR